MHGRDPTPQSAHRSADPSTDPFGEDGRYRWIRAAGEGGMAEVVEIEHVALGKRFVAKILKPKLAADANMLDRFRFEAQALARVAHPNLVAVLDVGRTADGRPFFVMEKLAGRTAGDELRARKVLPAAEAVEITRQILAGLGAAHAHGLVHRDVKLDNVFLDETANGRVAKVLDFGVAKTRRTGDVIAEAPACPTAPGTVMGTPRYIAPEQIRGVGVDARADVYATGMLLYTLLAGRSAFAELSGFALLQAHLTQPPQPPSHWTHSPIPRELDEAVLRALAKDPQARFQSAAEFATELARIARHLGGGSFLAAAPRPRRGAAREPFLLAAVAAGSAVAFWLLFAVAGQIMGWR